MEEQVSQRLLTTSCSQWIKTSALRPSKCGASTLYEHIKTDCKRTYEIKEAEALVDSESSLSSLQVLI